MGVPEFDMTSQGELNSDRFRTDFSLANLALRLKNTKLLSLILGTHASDETFVEVLSPSSDPTEEV